MFQPSIIDHIRLSFGSAVGAYQGHTSAALRLSQWGWYSKIASLSLSDWALRRTCSRCDRATGSR